LHADELKIILLEGMDNGADLRAVDYKPEEVDPIFQSFLTQPCVKKA